MKTIHLSVCLLAAVLCSAPASASIQYGIFEGDTLQLAPTAAVQQKGGVGNHGYPGEIHQNGSGYTYGEIFLGVKDVHKDSLAFKKRIQYHIEAFNPTRGRAPTNCKHGDMNRCAFEDMLYPATNYFEPGKVPSVYKESYLQTNIDKSEYQLSKKLDREKAAKNTPYATYHILEKTTTDDQGDCFYSYRVHAGNISVETSARISKSDHAYPNFSCPDPEVREAAQFIANDILARLPHTGNPDVVAPSGEVQETQPETSLTVVAFPNAGHSNEAVIPASKLLPARLRAMTATDAKVTFEIISGAAAELRASGSTGRSVKVVADKAGKAEAFFYYQGGNITEPQPYEVRIESGGHHENVKIAVGLGLAFDRVVAVKADALDTHAFTLGVKSTFHPDMDVAGYLFKAHQSGVWGGRRVGVKLKTTWLNPPPGTESDKSFNGTANISVTRSGTNLLTVAQGEPQYYLTDFPYPAVVMGSDGKHTYQINGGIVLMDEEGKHLGFIEEGMRQSQALVIVARDTPEHWLASLACSLDAQSEVQYLLLESAKAVPVAGEAVDALTTATGLMCKFGKSEYESLFYDIGTILGGQYLNHLTQPEVFEKLTPKQQKAAQWAKANYDKLDEHKKKTEREKWLKPDAGKAADAGQQPPPVAGKNNEPVAQPTPPPAKKNDEPATNTLNDIQKSAEELKKSLKGIGDALQGIFK